MVPGAAIAPLVAASSEEALVALRARVETFSGARSLMRVRATSGGRTQSFRAQLVVPSREEMELIVYSPVGTVAATIRAKGNEISSDVPADTRLALTSWLSIAGATPAETALLILGLPTASEAVYEAASTGLRRAVLADAVVSFEPPQFPPVRVVITRGADVVEIEHQEIVATR